MSDTLRMQVQSDGVVVTLYGAKVLDVSTEWRNQVGDRPVLILARMVDSLVYWGDQYEVEPEMPGPEVLAALRGQA